MEKSTPGAQGDSHDEQRLHPECFICNSHLNDDGNKGPSDFAETLGLLVGYPSNILGAAALKVESGSSTDKLLHRLQQFVFCAECGSQLQQIRQLMTQLEEIHRQISQFQMQVSQRIHETLSQAESSSSLLSDVRRRVLQEIDRVSAYSTDHLIASKDQTPFLTEAPPPHCIVKLARLEEHPPSEEEPLEFVPHITIKQEPDLDLMDMEVEGASPPSSSASPGWSPPEDDSDEEYILPSSPVHEKKKRGRPRLARNLKRRRKQKNAGITRSRLGRHRCQHPECGFRAMRPSQLVSHVLVSHFRGPDGVFLCSKCGAFFPAQSQELGKHLDSHDGEEEEARFACPHCPASFSTFTNVCGHCRRRHSKKPMPTKADYPQARQRLSVTQFPCPHCPSIFSQLSNLRAHYRSRHPEEPLPTRAEFLSADMPRKETPKRFTCCHCSGAFSSLRYLRQHYQKHHPTEAEPTKKDFPLPKRKRVRRRLMPGPGAGPRTCPHCDEVFACITETDYKKHVACHTKPHKCTVEGCSAQFSTTLSLKFHCVRFHPELQVLPHSLCPHCPFMTNRPQTLRTHIRAKHETELTTSCSVAGCSFRTPEPSRLKQHMERVHEGQKKFLCTECGRGYYFQNKLSIHMRVHTGERPFACRVCGKDFTRKDKMQIHERTHGPDRPFVCDLCGFRFPTKNNLIGHRHSWHKNGLYRVGVQPTRKGKYNADPDPARASATEPVAFPLPLSLQRL